MKHLVQRQGTPVRLSESQFYLILLSVMASVTAAIVTRFVLVLHHNFLTVACDSAVLQSGIVNTLHGHWFANNGAGGPNILGTHTTFLLLLLVPIYDLAPSIDTLFILQAWGVYSTVIPLYLVARDVLQRPLVAFFIATMALASPLLLHMAAAPLHLETWILAAAFLSTLFYLRNNMTGFLAAFGFAVCCGEQAALIFMALGAAWLLVDDGFAWRKRFGRVALMAGLTWIVLAVMVISPLARGSDSFNLFAYNYSPWKIKSVSGLPMAVTLHPVGTIMLLTNIFRWQHVVVLIGVPLFSVLFSWRALVLLAPFPVYFLMSAQEFYLYFHSYYYSFAFFAGYLGVLFFLARREAADRLGIALLAGIFFSNVLFLCYASGSYIQLGSFRDDDFSNTLHGVFETIPPAATVYTPHRYSAYLSNRQNMVIGDLREPHLDFDAMMNAQFDATNVHPEQVDYIVCDYLTDQCGWRKGALDPGSIQHRMENIGSLVQGGHWVLFWSQNNVVILRRTGK